jgi:preprotein translocase subunit SecY
VAHFFNIAKVPEVRKRFIFTALLLAVYRIGIFISLPGVDRSQLSRAFSKLNGTLFGTLNMFSGGALEQASIFSLGVMPYISASISIQVLAMAVPALERLQKEGESGRRRISQYTRLLTLLLALLHGFGDINVLVNGFKNVRVVEDPSVGFFMMSVLTLAAGTMFVMWLGEQITEYGLGNGTSLLIFSGIIAQAPAGVLTLLRYVRSDMVSPASLVLLGLVLVATVSLIVFFEQATRRIPIAYAKRAASQGSLHVAPQSSYLPLKINSSGVIPPIFASSVLMFPATVMSFLPGTAVEKLFNQIHMDVWFYHLVYVLLIVFFCYFYTAFTFNPVDLADNLKKNGGYIPGIRPGKKTAEYIDHVLGRITLGGAIYISTICILPAVLASQFEMPIRFGGTGLLIVVGVALDTVRQLESYEITQQYEGFTRIQRPRIRERLMAG